MKLSLSMPLTFNSKQIDKIVTIDDVGSLSNPEVLLLKDELMTAIKSMDDYIKKFKQEKQEAYDKDWHQKVRRKQQVCKAFLSQLISLDHDESLFRSIYDKETTKFSNSDIFHSKISLKEIFAKFSKKK